MSTLVAQTISNGTVSTSSANVIQGSAKAWMSYKGTATRAIQGSYNVSSVTYVSTGLYTINFTNSFADANYAVTFGGSYAGTNDYGTYFTITNKTSSTFQVFTSNDVATARDYESIMVAVFR